MKNLYSEIPVDLRSEIIETVHQAGNIRIERIVSTGQSSSKGFWFDQPENEWVIVLKGAAKLRFDGDDHVVEMRAGDFIDITANRRHRVEWTTPHEPTVWLAIHYA